MRSRVLAALGAAALAVVTLVTVAPAVTAQEEADDRLTIRKVDTSDFPEVRITAVSTGGRPDLADFSLRENGELVERFDLVPVDETGEEIGVVLVIDTSGSMRENNALEEAKDAATDFVEEALPQQRIALVTFSGTVETVVNLTTDKSQLTNAIDGLAAGGDTAMWDGVRTAVGLLETRPELQPNIVLLSDGDDTVSTSTARQAESAALAAGAVVYGIGLQGKDFNEAPVRAISEATGGTYASAADPEALSRIYAGIQETLQSQYQIQYTSEAETETLTLLLTGGTAQAQAQVNVGAVATGNEATPEIITVDDGPLTGSLGKWIGALFGALALGLLAYVIARIITTEDDSLKTTLRHYAAEPGDLDDDEADRSFAETKLLQRAVAITGGFAERQGILPRVEASLERANLPLRAAEAIFFYVAGVALVALAAAFLTGSIAGFLLFLVLAVLLPPAILAFMASRRQKAFVSQLPDTLQLLASSLRAGYSLLQGVEAVSQEVEDPMGYELRRVLAEARLGRPLEEALDDCAQRMGSPDFDWAVMAIRIQREVGGNLSELLDTVSETMTQRERLRREIRALTAEGRVSAMIVGFMPIGIGLAVYSMNREYIEPLFEETVGQAMLIGAGVLMGIGFYWLKKTVEIEV